MVEAVSRRPRRGRSPGPPRLRLDGGTDARWLNRRVPVADSTAAVETVFRMEFPRVVAALARMANDLDLAEELAQETLVDALRQWPRDGVPSNPGAWLTAVGKRKAIDRFRRDRR